MKGSVTTHTDVWKSLTLHLTFSVRDRWEAHLCPFPPVRHCHQLCRDILMQEAFPLLHSWSNHCHRAAAMCVREELSSGVKSSPSTHRLGPPWIEEMCFRTPSRSGVGEERADLAVMILTRVFTDQSPCGNVMSRRGLVQRGAPHSSILSPCLPPPHQAFLSLLHPFPTAWNIFPSFWP